MRLGVATDVTSRFSAATTTSRRRSVAGPFGLVLSQDEDEAGPGWAPATSTSPDETHRSRR
eukprot:12600575-Heterocapsa_arctica.AAC.1